MAEYDAPESRCDECGAPASRAIIAHVPPERWGGRSRLCIPCFDAKVRERRGAEVERLIDEALDRMPLEDELRRFERRRRDHELYGDSFVRVWPKRKG